MANIRKCICCGKEYEYCPNCNKDNKPMWMMSFDCESCKDLFNLVSAYNMGRINADKVKAYARSHGLKPEAYTEAIRKVIEEPRKTNESSDVGSFKISSFPETDSEPKRFADMPFRRKKKKKGGYRFSNTRDIQ